MYLSHGNTIESGAQLIPLLLDFPLICGIYILLFGLIPTAHFLSFLPSLFVVSITSVISWIHIIDAQALLQTLFPL